MARAFFAFSSVRSSKIALTSEAISLPTAESNFPSEIAEVTYAPHIPIAFPVISAINDTASTAPSAVEITVLEKIFARLTTLPVSHFISSIQALLNTAFHQLTCSSLAPDAFSSWFSNCSIFARSWSDRFFASKCSAIICKWRVLARPCACLSWSS